MQTDKTELSSLKEKMTTLEKAVNFQMEVLVDKEKSISGLSSPVAVSDYLLYMGHGHAVFQCFVARYAVSLLIHLVHVDPPPYWSMKTILVHVDPPHPGP